jgi:SAM-dependent methyltransferase
MPALARTWMLAARGRRRFARHRAPREELVMRFAPGRTFADIGCMWRVHGAIAFLAEECGATAVTGLDLMPASEQFADEHGRRSSKVRFLQGDLHEPEMISEVGPHDVVWCSGVLYHSPNPLLALERLRTITRQVLVLATETIPEVPGLAQAAVFLPSLPDRDRRVHAQARPGTVALGVSAPFDRSQSYGAWWWGLSGSAVKAMLRASGFEVMEERGSPFNFTVVARPAA